jgi:protein SCO1/2
MKVRIFWWGLLIFTLAGVSAASVWKLVYRNRAEPTLPILGTVNDFTLIDQSKRAITRQDLSGQIWVADFIYTECGDQCPRLSQKMEKIQTLLPKEARVQLLSFSVDPGHDTPAVLSHYAQRFHADPLRWRFLTGSPEKIHALAENFKLAPRDTTSRSFTMNHSTRLMVVDARSRIRGYYDGTDEAAVQRLMKDVSDLSNEGASQ